MAAHHTYFQGANLFLAGHHTYFQGANSLSPAITHIFKINFLLPAITHTFNYTVYLQETGTIAQVYLHNSVKSPNLSREFVYKKMATSAWLVCPYIQLPIYLGVPVFSKYTGLYFLAGLTHSFKELTFFGRPSHTFSRS